MGRIPMRMIATTLLLVPIPWLCRRIGYGYLSAQTPLDLPLLFFLIMNLQGLYPSTDFPRSLSVLVQNVIQVALFYSVVNGLTDRRRAGLVYTGLVLSAVIVALGSLGNTQWSQTKLFSLPQVYDFLAQIHVPWLSKLAFHPNFVGAALAMLSPLAIAIVWSSLHLQWRLLAGLSLLIVLPVLGLTQSRGALIGLAAALVFIAAYRCRVVRLALPAIALATGLVVYRMGPAQVADIVLITDVTTSAQGRLEVWTRALYMIQDFPFTGIGLGTYGTVARVLYPFFLIGPDTLVAHPHNIYLGAAVDLGLPGFVAFTAFTVVCLMIAVSGLRRASGTDLEPLFLGILGGMVVYLVHGMLDQVTFSTKTGAALWVMMGLATAMWLRLPDWVSWRSWAADSS